MFNHKSNTYVDIDDARIYYEEIGDKNLPVLLLLHGGLNDIEIFNAFLEVFPKQFRIIGIDSRGHGMSTIGSYELTYLLLQKEVEIILKYLGIDQFSILGFSNGGTIAYRLAAYSNLRVDKIVTIGSPWSMKHLDHLIPMFSRIKVKDWKHQCPHDYARYQKLNPEPNIDQIFNQVMQLALDMSPRGRPNESVKNIKSSILAIRGEHDPIVSKENLDELCSLAKMLWL